MESIRHRLATVRSRQQLQWVWQCVAWGLIIGGAVACVAAVLILTKAVTDPGWPTIASLLLAGPVLGSLFALILALPMSGAAAAIDHACGLKDRAVTAWAFLAKPDLSPLQQLQLVDAENHLSNVVPARVAPYRIPRPFSAGLLLTVLAIAMLFMVPAPEQAVASTEANAVVVDQANRAAEELKQLEEFNQDEKDPELEKLLKELAAKVEELKQPGVDPKEALAKLSEMEATLQAKQQQLADPNVEAQLKSVGEALSLADPLQSAGQALANGELEKAAEELEKQELPKLDRQTEKAVTEKLEKLQQDSADGMKKALKEALGQIGEGLGQGNKSKYQDGMQGLAGECKKQGRKNKLADLLRKQCQCLSECKGECESECKNTGDSKKKGGNKWGLARSGNEPGEKTALLKSSKDMNLTGQESAEGDVDIETTTAPEQKQEAVRQYREKVDKYKALSESVLDAESIPLGHRQNIRRYFELIRPAGGAEEISPASEASQPATK